MMDLHVSRKTIVLSYSPLFLPDGVFLRKTFFNFDPISNLKLRASWGHLGNQEIGNYAYQNKYSLGRLYGFGNIMYSGIAENYSMSNSTIGWENTEMVNAGLDLNMLNNRLSFTFDYFVRNTRDILMSLPQPTILGAYAPVINAGACAIKALKCNWGGMIS